MKDINGYNYDRKSFDSYKLRLKLNIVDTDKEEHQLDIYTTQTDVDQAKRDLLEITTDKVDSLEIIHHATKEQDDLTSKFIDEIMDKI